MLRGYEVEDIAEMKAVGLSIQAISERTGYDRKTVRKHLLETEAPVYGPRPPRPSILDPFQPYLEDRLGKGVWNAEVLLRELRKLGYGGGKTILKEWLQPRREAATAGATRRFETPPGKQAQADWGHLGYLEAGGVPRKVWGLAITLGYSRRLWSQASLDQKLGTLVRMHDVTDHAICPRSSHIVFRGDSHVVRGE